MKAMIFGAVVVIAAGPAAAYWGDDVWEDPARPFLYYGEVPPTEPEKAPSQPTAVPLASLTTLEALRAERERRLSAAVMTPSAETIRDYLEVNAFVNEKAALFAAGWRDVLLSHPEFDWTALHPTVNAASTALTREDDVSDAPHYGALCRDLENGTRRRPGGGGSRVGRKRSPHGETGRWAAPHCRGRVDGVSGVGACKAQRRGSHEGAPYRDRGRRRCGTHAALGAVDGRRSPGGAAGVARGV